jgi:hypothetical protein
LLAKHVELATVGERTVGCRAEQFPVVFIVSSAMLAFLFTALSAHLRSLVRLLKAAVDQH